MEKELWSERQMNYKALTVPLKKSIQLYWLFATAGSLRKPN
jgi:hypothetical protein